MCNRTDYRSFAPIPSEVSRTVVVTGNPTVTGANVAKASPRQNTAEATRRYGLLFPATWRSESQEISQGLLLIQLITRNVQKIMRKAVT